MSLADLARAVADERLPAAIVDLDALDANIRAIAALAGPGTLRVASKSVRVPWLLRHVLDADPKFHGLMAYSAHEAALLYARGFDDLLVAYPAARRDEAEALATLVRAGANLLATIDDPAHVDVLAKTGVAIPVSIDVDVSWKPMGLHVGVRRSPIRDADAARKLARIAADAGLPVRGVMAYEAQVAGLSDTGPFYEVPVRRFLKARSRPLAAERRRQVVEALKADGHAITVVNGGGTGSLRTTPLDGSVTEATAGSGFLCSHLFDGYGIPRVPAAFFALAVVRRSDVDHVTCYGGGVIASGSGGVDRWPKLVYPDNLAPLGLEGWGEVQTPFKVTSGSPPAIGDVVLARPAKAGEWLERFNEVLLVRNGTIVGREPTTRGLGLAG